MNALTSKVNLPNKNSNVSLLNKNSIGGPVTEGNTRNKEKWERCVEKWVMLCQFYKKIKKKIVVGNLCLDPWVWARTGLVSRWVLFVQAERWGIELGIRVNVHILTFWPVSFLLRNSNNRNFQIPLQFVPANKLEARHHAENFTYTATTQKLLRRSLLIPSPLNFVCSSSSWCKWGAILEGPCLVNKVSSPWAAFPWASCLKKIQILN